MQVNKENTEVMVKNMRAEGHNSRADYMELMQARNAELVAELGRVKELALSAARAADIAMEGKS